MKSLKVKRTIEVGHLIGYLLQRDIEIRNEYEKSWSETEKRECQGRLKELGSMLDKLGWEDICDKANKKHEEVRQ